MAGTGKRGPGRPRNAEKFAHELGSFSRRCAEQLDPAFDELLRLIKGATRVEVRRQAAGTVTRKDVARHADGKLILDARGKPTPVEVLAFPDLPPGRMVDVEEKEITLPPEIRAIDLMVQRIGGRSFAAEDEVPPDADGLALDPAQLATLDPQDLDDLARIAAKLAAGRPAGGPGGGPGG